MARLITGLDIGSSNIRAAVCMADNSETVRLLALDNIPSKGISSGQIIDFDAAGEALRDIITRLKQKSKKRIKFVSVALSGIGLSGFESDGMLGLSKRPRRISVSDIERCKKIASLTQIPADRQIIQKEIKDFYINENQKVTNALGLYATKLRLKLYIVTIENAAISNLQRLIEQAGYMLDRVIFSGSALARGILTEEERRFKIAIVDIGSRLTIMSIFDRNHLSDISILTKGALDIKDRSSMLGYFKELLPKIKDKDLLKIIFTGGGALKEDLLETAEENLKVKCGLGKIKLKWCPLTAKDALLHTASLGLIAFEVERLTAKRHRERTLPHRLTKFVSDVFQSYF